MEFNSLLCLNNMPIKRFADWLIRRNTLSEYMALLVEAFNPEAVLGVMCHQTLSVAWDGRLYDCDFNQQLDMPILEAASAAGGAAGAPYTISSSSGSDSSEPEAEAAWPQQKGLTVWEIDTLDELTGGLIRVGSHCYGCTAGTGSSCQGSTA